MRKAAPHATRWTLIVKAQGTGAVARKAMSELVREYEPFILWLIQRCGHPPDANPEDLKQEFLTGFVRRTDIVKLDRRQGSFHGWLKVAVRSFLCNEWNAWKTVRSGRQVTAATPFDAFDYTTPEDELCTRAFAAQVVRNALARHRDEVHDRARFDQLVRFLPGPQLDLTELAPLATSMQISRTALAKHICLMRARFRELLRDTVRDTIDLDDACGDVTIRDPGTDPASRAVDAELQELYRCFYASEPIGVLRETR